MAGVNPCPVPVHIALQAHPKSSKLYHLHDFIDLWHDATICSTPVVAHNGHETTSSMLCVVEDLVVGDEAPVGGVAQVIGHGVKVIGVEVGVHGEEGREKDGEVQEEVKGEVEQLRERRSSWMACG